MVKKWRVLTAVALALGAAPAFAGLCTTMQFSTNQQCTFATDTSGGTAIFRNPDSLFNVGSGGITPFLTTQRNGTEFGVSTDIPNVNLLPLDDKRDNSNTFTNTFSVNNLGTVTIGGTTYFDFFLDINEPNGGDAALISIDTLRIWGRQGTTGETDPFLITKNDLPTFGDLDTLVGSLNLALVYALGPSNGLILNFDLFSGSGKGWDMEFLIPVSAFAGLAPDSRILFSVGYGAAGCDGCSTADGFEEWGYKTGAVPPPPPPPLPEPGTLVLLGAALAGLGWTQARRRHA